MPSAVALYLRMSEDRTGEGLGVDRQRAECAAYAERRGWTVAGEYVDNDVSATSSKARPAYRRMLAAVEAGTVDGIIAWDLDRLHRRPTELEAFIGLADRHALALGTIGGDVDLGTAAGRLHARIMGSVARHEIEHKSERQVVAARQAASLGKATGGPRPFGYAVGGMTLDDRETTEVRRAYADVLAGVSLREVARRWNGAGLVTSRQGTWGATQVRAVLLRARNAGLRTYRGEVVGLAQWPGIVDEPTWRAAVALIGDPSRKTSPGFATRWLLSALARCGVCGATVSSAGTARIRRDGERRTVYRCRTRQHVARDARPVDDLVTRVVLARLSQPDASGLLADRDAPDATALVTEAGTIRGRLDEVAAAYAAGALDLGQLTTASDALRARLRAVQARQGSSRRVPVLGALVGAEDVRRVWDALPFERQRAVVDLLVQVTIDPVTEQGPRVFDPSLVRIGWRTA